MVERIEHVIDEYEQEESGEFGHSEKQRNMDRSFFVGQYIQQGIGKAHKNGLYLPDKKEGVYDKSENLVYVNDVWQSELDSEVGRSKAQRQRRIVCLQLSSFLLDRLISIERAFKEKNVIDIKYIKSARTVIWDRILYQGAAFIIDMKPAVIKELNHALILEEKTGVIKTDKKKTDKKTSFELNLTYNIDAMTEDEIAKKFAEAKMQPYVKTFIRIALYVTYNKELQWYRKFNTINPEFLTSLK